MLRERYVEIIAQMVNVVVKRRDDKNCSLPLLIKALSSNSAPWNTSGCIEFSESKVFFFYKKIFLEKISSFLLTITSCGEMENIW